MIASNLSTLLRFINELPELEHLALQLHHRLLPQGKGAKEKGKAVDLSALSRVQSAFLLTNDRASVFYEALKHHAERNTALLSLGLQSCVDAEQFYRSKMARLSAPFAAKFLALDLGRAKLSQQDMDALGGHFSALTNLGLSLSTPIPLLPILLRSAKSLTRLHLYIHTATYMQLSSGIYESNWKGYLPLNVTLNNRTYSHQSRHESISNCLRRISHLKHVPWSPVAANRGTDTHLCLRVQLRLPPGRAFSPTRADLPWAAVTRVQRFSHLLHHLRPPRERLCGATKAMSRHFTGQPAEYHAPVQSALLPRYLSLLDAFILMSLITCKQINYL